MKSLLKQKDYSREWVKDFYTQAGIWWGEDPQEGEENENRVKLVEHLCGLGVKRILDLGCGGGRSAAVMADCGHHVTGVELNSTDVGYARNLLKTTRKGSLAFLEADFYTVQVEGTFDVITCWQVFGIGSDADQRKLLKRISREWLAPGGSVLMDVYHPAGPARNHRKEWHLNAIPDVPGSVEMIERCYYDPVYNRWIDEWQPVAHPENTLAQTVRCYTPADLLLLLEGTGLCLKYIESEGRAVDFASNSQIADKDFFAKHYNYLVQLVRE